MFGGTRRRESTEGGYTCDSLLKIIHKNKPYLKDRAGVTSYFPRVSRAREKSQIAHISFGWLQLSNICKTTDAEDRYVALGRMLEARFGGAILPCLISYSGPHVRHCRVWSFRRQWEKIPKLPRRQPSPKLPMHGHLQDRHPVAALQSISRSSDASFSPTMFSAVQVILLLWSSDDSLDRCSVDVCPDVWIWTDGHTLLRVIPGRGIAQQHIFHSNFQLAYFFIDLIY